MEMKAYIAEECGKRTYTQHFALEPRSMQEKLQCIATDAHVANGHIEAAQMNFDHPSHSWSVVAYECDVRDGRIVLESIEAID